MKKLYLFGILCCCASAFAASLSKGTSNPAIGVLLQPTSFGPGINEFIISVKNTGEETLTNIYITSDTGVMIFGTTSWGDVIPSMAPGEEIYYAFGGQKPAQCTDMNQVIVHATTSGGSEITDLSGEFDYYSDDMTFTYIDDYIYAQQDGIYVDLNGNSMVDVGDAVNYTYSIPSANMVEIYDSNAIVDNPTGFGPFTTTGIHYLTAADVAEGYVYNSATLNVFDSCSGSGMFQDPTPCMGCPGLSNCPNCVVTPLTSALPNSISGNVKFNINNDNCASGLPFPNRKISTDNGLNTYASYTNPAGSYSIIIPSNGTFSTTPLSNLGSNFSSNPASVSVASTGSGNDYANTDFCVSSATNYADLHVALIPIDHPRPGFSASYKLCFRNYGSTNLNGTIQLSFDDGKLTFNSATPAVNSTTSNSLTWNYTNLLPFEYRIINLTLNVMPPPGAATGDLLTFTLSGPMAGDANVDDNIFTMEQTVVSSFDPNDKTVVEGAYIGLNQVDDYLHYVTRFQNTGTAAATTVVLKETLDPKLDWTTFEPIAASHDYIIQVVNGNDMTVTFPNIGLPDSGSNEPASHGWMAYRIKPKSNIVVNDVMTSQANIFFDYNAPIATNSVSTQLTSLGNSQFSSVPFTIYPNPASTTIRITNGGNFSFQILDINGKMLLSGNSGEGDNIDVSSLQAGFYLVKVTTTTGSGVLKFIKS